MRGMLAFWKVAGDLWLDSEEGYSSWALLDFINQEICRHLSWPVFFKLKDTLLALVKCIWYQWWLYRWIRNWFSFLILVKGISSWLEIFAYSFPYANISSLYAPITLNNNIFLSFVYWGKKKKVKEKGRKQGVYSLWTTSESEVVAFSLANLPFVMLGSHVSMGIWKLNSDTFCIGIFGKFGWDYFHFIVIMMPILF